jgi:hypothetical protein
MTIARDTPSHTDLENGPALSCTDAATERISHGCLLDVASNLRRQRLRMASMSWALPMRLRPRMRSSPARL